MKVRFLTSIAGDTFAYVEGQTRELPDPIPQPFRNWLRDGVIERVEGVEVALAPRAIERAVARRVGKGQRGRRRQASVQADACP